MNSSKGMLVLVVLVLMGEEGKEEERQLAYS
jgi:hypothetical protein